MALPLLLAVVLHEYAHGWVANFFGDSTAKDLGRLTLNPIPHIDRLGTIIVPILCLLLPGSFLVGWAKPVPVDPRNFRNPKKDMLLVALAGPVSNVLTAALAAVALKVVFENFGAAAVLSSPGLSTAVRLLVWFIFIGVVLAVFNMIPLPPLDGSRVLYGLLPDGLARRYMTVERYGIFILFAVFIFGGSFLGYLIRIPVAVFIGMCGFSESQLRIVVWAMNPSG